MDSISDRGRTALVVGAASGIGRAVAEKLVAKGLRVLIADIDVVAAKELATSADGIEIVGGRAWDATDAIACNELIGQAGAIDVLVSTVGWTAVSPFLDETPEYWQRVVDLNLMSAIYLAAAAGRAMRGRGGSIVLTASEAGQVGTSGETVYAAAKAGVIGLVKSVARELARDNIRVNAVAPGLTDTPLLASQTGEGILERIVRQIPLRRVGSPEEIAAAITFLALDESSYITGQTLCVGGGLTMSS
jgi:NAD(P)-dependent dehydrogenase (short-subunit alcohol dehydrogenase family)